MTNIELTKLVEQQQSTIGHLSSRVSTLTDEMLALQGTVEAFKGHVANDIQRVIEALRSK